MANRTSPILHQNNCFLFSLSSNRGSRFHSFLSLHSKKSLPLPSLSFSSSSLSTPAAGYFGLTRVSTASVEYAAPVPDSNFHEEIRRLKSLQENLSNCKNLEQKLRVLDSDSHVKHFFNTRGFAWVLVSLNALFPALKYCKKLLCSSPDLSHND